MKETNIPEPWLSFLTEIDRSLDGEIAFHCFGGFAIKLLYGLPRETADLDIVSAVVRDEHDRLQELAGKLSPLHVKYGVFLDMVGTIAVLPDSYDERMTKIAAAQFQHIQLQVMDPHDIILAKLGRDAPKDIHDLMYLARVAELDTTTLSTRYDAELRPYVIGPPERADGTLNYWIKMIDEIKTGL